MTGRAAFVVLLLIATTCSNRAATDTTASVTTRTLPPTTAAPAPSAAPEPQAVNLAATADVTSSASLPGQPLSRVNDGIRDLPAGNFWGSGGLPPQWIDFDFRAVSTIERIELLVSQSPTGETAHDILGRAADEPWKLLETITGTTSDGQSLIVEPVSPWHGIRYLRIATTASPSWVSWGEVEIWGHTTPGVSPQTTTTLAASEGAPDLVLHGGTVITVDSAFGLEEALAIRGGLILAVGSTDEILGMAGPGTKLVDLGGATVMPGIVDPHTHMIQHETPDPEAMASAQQTLIESGRTTVGIPSIIPLNMEGFDAFRDRAVIRIRLYVSYNTSCGDPPPDTELWRSVDFAHDPSDRIAIAGVKVFADGGSCHGPAVAWEYPDPLPETIGFVDWTGSGSLFITAEELAAVVSETGDRGGQTVVHAAGERAVITALDGMEQALGDGGNSLRHRLDHNDFVPPGQRTRYGELGVVPVVFGDYDSCFEPGGIWSLLAPREALEWHRANRDLIAANPDLPVAWHSDTPFTHIDVFTQLQMLANVAEVTEDGNYCEPPDFLADQGVEVSQAVRMMTRNAAFAMNLEDHAGSLEPGKWADLIVVESNPLDQPEDQLYRNVVWATLVGGVTEHCGGPAELCARLAG